MSKLSKEDFKNLHIVLNQSDNYFALLREAHIDLLKKTSPQYLCFAYLSLCAATLEYSLNRLYSDFDRLRSVDTKVSGFESMGLKLKLHSAARILTQELFHFNLEYPAIIELGNLIDRRNRLLHNDSQVIKIDPAKIDEKGMYDFEITHHVDSLTKRECIEYGKALGVLKSQFFDAYYSNTIKENDLLHKS